MHTETPTTALHGVMAEFDTGQALVDAARQTMAQGFTKVEAYSPVPIEELNDIIHKKRTILPKLVLAGGLTGMATGFALQYWASVIEYPMNVGGRPMASWTTFIVPSYELTILFAALTAAIGMIVLNGLPQPYHPVFNVERFSMASSDKFFLVIESTDAKFDHARRERVPAQHRREGSVRRCGSNLTLAVLAAAALVAGCRQDMHDAPRYEAFEASSTVRRRPRLAHPAGRHGAARLAARRRSALHRQGRRRAGRPVSVRDRARGSRARPAALQHLLHAVPRHARRRQRHGGAARPAAGGVVPPGSPAPGEGRLLLRRDHQRLRRDAGLRRADPGSRSLADRRLRARAAVQPARVGRRRAGGSARGDRRRSATPAALRRAKAAPQPSRRRNTSGDARLQKPIGRKARRCRA